MDKDDYDMGSEETKETLVTLSKRLAVLASSNQRGMVPRDHTAMQTFASYGSIDTRYSRKARADMIDALMT